MQIIIGQVLSADEVKTVLGALKHTRFVDGRATAGFAARLVKDNRQAEGADRSLATIRRLIAERILGKRDVSARSAAEDVIAPAARPL